MMNFSRAGSGSCHMVENSMFRLLAFHQPFYGGNKKKDVTAGKVNKIDYIWMIFAYF